MKLISSIFFCIAALWSANIFADDVKIHQRPTPSLPQIMHPALANDVFTLSLMSQIHGTLFEIGADHLPIPSLVERFDVTENGTLYKFEIKQAMFHNGNPLSSQIIKSSLEDAVRMKTSGHEKLGAIRGYQDFVSGKSGNISGIHISDDRKLEIRLSSANPQLIESLSDIHFAIVDSKSGVQNGLGPYRIIEANSKHILIEHTQKAGSGSPEKVAFVPRDKETAIRDFVTGNASDLFLYSLTEADIAKVKNHGHVTSVHFPRTYFVAANSKRLESIQVRSEILKSIDRSKLLAHCYGGNSLTDNIVPPGFQGHVNDLKTIEYAPPEKLSIPKKTLKVGVAKGVDAESCAAKNLESMLNAAGFRATVKIEETDKLINAWKNRELDVFFAYLESENTLEMLQFFHPDATVSLGDPSDREMAGLLAKYESSTDPVQKKEVAASISRSIASSSLIVPLFHPRQYLVYSKKYEQISGGLRSPNLIRLDVLRSGEKK